MQGGENPRGIVGAEDRHARQCGVDGSGLVFGHGVGSRLLTRSRERMDSILPQHLWQCKPFIPFFDYPTQNLLRVAPQRVAG